jgi:ADP-heptose:LPS heptosyltransferase
MIRLPASLSDPGPRREDFERAANFRLALLSENFRPLLRRAALVLARGAAPSAPAAWRRGLILGPSHIGDVLYNTPALPALRAGLPECRWTCAASAASAPVLRGNPACDEVLVLPESGRFIALRGRRFDVALTYATNPWRDLLLAAALGIPNRVGYVHKGFSGLVTHPVTIDLPQPFPAYFRDLVLQLTGAPPESIPSLRPLLYPAAAEEEALERQRQRLGLEWNGPPLLACAVTSRQRAGIWPAEKFLQAILHFRRQTRCIVLYLGAKEDTAELRALAARSGPDTHVLAGDLELPAVALLLRRCRAALATDSAVRHLANAAGIPVVFIRNLAVRAVETGAYTDTEIDLAPPGLERLPLSAQPAAFDQIDPKQVAGEVIRLLEGGSKK